MRASLVIHQSLLAFSIGAAVYSCKGAGVNPDGSTFGGGGGSAAGAASPATTGNFLGRWAGKYASKDSSASLHETTAKVAFAATDSRTGTFRIDLSAISDAYSAGNYTIIDQKTLMLDVKQSTISTIGIAGTQPLLEYMLIGNTFELSNDQITMTLAPDSTAGNAANPTQQPTDNGADRSANPAGSNATANPSGKVDALVGHWVCQDRVGNQWDLKVRDTNMFNIEIFDVTGNRGSIYLEGPVVITRSPGKPAAELRVQTSDVAKYQGMALQLSERGDMNLDMLRVATKESIPCDRQ